MDNFLRLGLVALATARLTRVVTTDWIGYWWLRQPAQMWALRAEAVHMKGPRPPLSEMALPDEPRTWQGKLVKGLDCPFCVGFWIGGLVLLASRLPGAKIVLGTLALNYVVGHVSSRIDG